MKLTGAIAILVLALLAGCATKEPTVVSKPALIPAPEVARPPPAPQQPEVYSRLAGRKIRLIAVKPISVKADCSYRDPTGYGGKLNLLVEDSQVRTLQAEIQVPKRGNCAFALKDFRQTAKEPSVTLSSSRGACTVRVWEQEGKVTVAFNSCRDRCEGDSFDYVWPILVDARTGKCS